MTTSDRTRWHLEKFSIEDSQFFQDWTLLSNKYHSNNQFLSCEFLKSLLEYFYDDTLVSVRASNHGEIQCIMLLRQRNKLIWELFKPSQAQAGLLLINPEFKPDIDLLLKVFPSNVGRIDFLSLDPDEHLCLMNAVNTDQMVFNAINMQIKLQGSFEDYWQLRSKNLRKNMSRYENRLVREDVILDFRQLTDPQDISSAVDRYGILESKGWKGKLGTALHPSNKQGQFYRGFLQQLAENANAVAYEFYIKDRLVASRLCCSKSDMLIILKTTFDEDFKSFALGRLLLKKIVTTLFLQDKIKTIDFYTNASPEQLEWATQKRTIYNGSLYSKRLSGKMLRLLTALKEKLTKESDVEAGGE